MKMMDILKRGGGAATPDSSDEEIIYLDNPEDMVAVADDIIGAASKTGGGEDDEYMESILETFAPYVGAEFESDDESQPPNVEEFDKDEPESEESSEGMVIAESDESEEGMVMTGGAVEDTLESVDPANLITIGDSDDEQLFELGDSDESEEPEASEEPVDGGDESEEPETSEEPVEPETSEEPVEGGDEPEVAELEDSSDEFNVDLVDNIDGSALADINELMSKYDDTQ